jgi:poly(hydroxyalkanoate) depolymerase family esterase
MKNTSPTPAARFDAQAINDTIRRALKAAGLETPSGPMRTVTDIIQRAWAAGGLPGAAAAPDGGSAVIDVVARVVEGGDGVGPQPTAQTAQSAQPQAPRAWAAAGRFTSHRYSNAAGTRDYKLYVPAGTADAPRPLLVMLHGCTQSADDFAAGTQMNRLADAHGILVVYPEQAAEANASRCWNWFRPEDQARGAGEPALIAGIVHEVAARHGVDERRIFVAGLSAGAAMAVVLGQTYPEMFAAVGAHSGLPYASAQDIPSALAAMKGGRSGLLGLQRRKSTRAAPRPPQLQPLPLIVFHGDRDHTVQHSNGEELVRQTSLAYATTAAQGPLMPSTQAGAASGGRSYSRQRWANAAGHTLLESWTVHGAGHAWSGGDARGSYSDSAGPDASAEMLRFFLALPRGGTA